MVRGYPQGVPYDPEFGFITNLIWDGIFTTVPANSVRLGFLNEFQAHHIFGFAHYTVAKEYTLEYERYGDPPTEPIALVDTYGGIEVTDKSVDNFSVSGEAGFSHLTVKWGFFGTFGANRTTVFWDVYAPSGADYKNLPELPSKITSPFSTVDFSDRTLRSVLFHRGSRTYEDIVNETFKGQVRKPFEQFSKRVFE